MRRCVQLSRTSSGLSSRFTLPLRCQKQPLSTSSYSVGDISEVKSADAFSARGKHSQALPLLERALEIIEHVPEPSLQIAVRQRLAHSYREVFKFKKEEQQRAAVLQHMDKTTGPEDLQSKAQKDYVKCLLRLGRKDDAFKSATQFADAMQGSQFLCGALAMKGIAAMFAKPDIVLPTLTDALEADNAAGKDQLLVHQSLSLCHHYLNKDFEAATTAFQAAIASAEVLESPLSAIRAYANAGWILIANHKFQEAEEVIKKALHLSETKYGDEHPLVAVSLTQLAHNYHQGGEFVTSEALYRSALDYLRNACNEPSGSYSNLLSHQNYVDSMWAFSCLVENLIWNDKARKSEAEAIRKQLREFLADKPLLQERQREKSELVLEDWMM